MNLIFKIDKIIEGIQTFICVFLFTLILVLGSIQIFGRYIFSFSAPWTEEIMRFACIWLAMVGSSLTIRVDGHVSVDVAISFLKNNKVKTIIFVISRLICVIFLIVYFPSSIKLIISTKNSYATSIPLPYFYVYSAVPVGIIMMILSYFSAIPRYAKKYLNGEL